MATDTYTINIQRLEDTFSNGTDYTDTMANLPHWIRINDIQSFRLCIYNAQEVHMLVFNPHVRSIYWHNNKATRVTHTRNYGTGNLSYVLGEFKYEIRHLGL